MFKRLIYNTLGILSFIVPLIILIDTKFTNGKVWGIIGAMFIIYLLYAVISLVLMLVYAITGGDFKEPDGFVLFTFFFFFLKNKRIYYSDLGYFYIRPNRKGDQVRVYKQGYFFYDKLFEVHHNKDIETLSIDIKCRLDYMYKEELERLKVKKAIKDWDGYLDLPSKRDDKLNQLIK